MNPIFQGSVTNGVLYLDDVAAYQRQIASLDGKPVEVILRRHREKRSLPQNSYYWSVVVKMIADHCGYLPEEAHEALKLRLLETHGVEALPTVGSTANLDTKAFAEYVDRCIQVAAELNIIIPAPGEAE